MSNGHPASCPGCVPCEDDGCPTPAYCIDERPTGNLCNHHAVAVCSEHWPGTCPDCQHQAFAEMAETGDYDPRADPFYTPGPHSGETLREALARQWAYLAERKAETGFDPVTNSYSKRGTA